MNPSPLLLCLFVACATEPGGRPAPADALYFPLGIALSEDSAHVYVLNTNFDQRYRSGWLHRLSVDAVVAAARDEHGQSLPAGDVVTLPSLGGALARSPDGLLLSAHRGAGVLSVVEERLFHCGSAEPGAQNHWSACDDEHLVPLAIGGEVAKDPLGVALFQQSGTSFVAVGDAGKGEMVFLERQGTWFHPVFGITLGQAVGPLSLHEAAGRQFLLAGGQASSGNARLFALDLASTLERKSAVVREAMLGASMGASRVVAAVSHGTDVIAATRAPDSLALLRGDDVAADSADSGDARYTLSLAASFPLGGQAACLVPGVLTGRSVLFVCGFEEGALYVFDLAGPAPALLSRVDGLGEGPAQLAQVETPAGTVLLVTLFYAHALAVLDASGAPEDVAVIGRVGPMGSDAP